MSEKLPPRPYAPRLIPQAYRDPEAIFALVRRHAPYDTIQRYVANEEELAAVSRERNADGSARKITVVPWFRGDWAYDEPLVPGGAEILANELFAEAAREIFDAEVVRPQIVYVNLMAGMPFAGEGHIDVPAFRGVDRSQYPVWLLHAMGRSGLFRRWQIDLATAVSWFYEGEGGHFDYWPEGTAKHPKRLTGALTNQAIVGDNDFMFHRVGAIGKEMFPGGMGLATQLCACDDAASSWELREGDTVHARYSADQVRTSISWKAEVFRSEADARLRDEHSDDLGLADVVRIFSQDLDTRGIAHSAPSPEQALADRSFIATLTDAYPIAELEFSEPA